MADPIKLVTGKVQVNEDMQQNLRIWNQIAAEGKLKSLAIVGVEHDGSTRFWWHHGDNHRGALMGALAIAQFRIMEQAGDVTEISSEEKPFDDPE